MSFAHLFLALVALESNTRITQDKYHTRIPLYVTIFIVISIQLYFILYSNCFASDLQPQPVSERGYTCKSFRYSLLL